MYDVCCGLLPRQVLSLSKHRNTPAHALTLKTEGFWSAVSPGLSGAVCVPHGVISGETLDEISAPTLQSGTCPLTVTAPSLCPSKAAPLLHPIGRSSSC